MKIKLTLAFMLMTMWLQAQDCVFDATSLNDDFLKKSEFVVDYQWDNQKKTATVLLKNNAVGIVKKWACTHYGTDITIMQTIGDDMTANDDMMKKILQDLIKDDMLAAKHFVNISTTSTDEKMNLDMSNETFPEFYLEITNTGNTRIYHLFFYRT